MGKIVGVRFHPGAKIYDFDSGNFVLSVGDRVVVETELGQVMGEVARGPRVWPDQLQPEDHPPLKKVHRLADDQDLEQLAQNRATEREGMIYCRQRIDSQGLAMNLCKVECLFDRSKIIFYFTADSRQDFRELVRDLVARFRTRVEMRQIGVRHEAKLLGGIGSCGRELCCATFLGEFDPVSVKMAKEQNLSLNPTKISGLCGRLMCCLTYEYDTYRDLKQGMPKLGKKVVLADGTEGKVVRQNVLERRITLYLHGGGELTLTPEELAQEMARPQRNIPPAPKRGPDSVRPGQPAASADPEEDASAQAADSSQAKSNRDDKEADKPKSRRSRPQRPRTRNRSAKPQDRSESTPNGDSAQTKQAESSEQGGAKKTSRGRRRRRGPKKPDQAKQ